MKRLLAFVAVMTLAGALPARANTIVYSENFNDPGFLGPLLNLAGIDPVGDVTERWGTDSRYAEINDFNGWAFGGSSYLARQPSTGNQAVLLNETTGVATKLVGLTPNGLYTLAFNLSGDNRPGDDYVFRLDVNTVNVLNVTDSWLVTNPAGHSQTVGVQADGSGQLNLKFYQGSTTQASPIVDDIVVSTVPDGGSTVMLLGSALIGLGALRRKSHA